MGDWNDAEPSSGKGALAREIILGLLPLVIAIAVMVAIIAGLLDLISVALLSVGNRTVAQTQLVRCVPKVELGIRPALSQPAHGLQ